MSDENKVPDVDPLYISIMMSLEASAMQSLGKIANPMTGKIERNLEQARMTIDMVEMLEKKTSGNLTADEENMTKRILYQLRMNYVDEVNADSKKSEEQASAPEDSDKKETDKPAEDNTAESEKN